MKCKLPPVAYTLTHSLSPLLGTPTVPPGHLPDALAQTSGWLATRDVPASGGLSPQPWSLRGVCATCEYRDRAAFLSATSQYPPPKEFSKCSQLGGQTDRIHVLSPHTSCLPAQPVQDTWALRPRHAPWGMCSHQAQLGVAPKPPCPI